MSHSGAPAFGIAEGPGGDVRYLAGARIPPAYSAAKARAVDDVRIDGIGNIIIALVGADRVPVAPGDLAIIAAAGDRDRSAVLLAAVNPIGETVVRGDVTELAGRLVVPATPGSAAVDGHRCTLIGSFGDMPRVLGIDPD